MLKRNLLLSALFMGTLFIACNREDAGVLDAPEQQVATTISGEVIDGQYIVVLKGDDVHLKTAIPTYSGRQLAMKKQAMELLPGRDLESQPLEQVYSDAIRGFAAQLNGEELDQLSKDSRVDYVLPDRMFILKKPGTVTVDPPGQTIPYGISRVGKADGTGKTAWIIDTGIDLDHPDLNVDASRGAYFVRAKSADDDNGHGSHCAGIVAALDNEIGVVGVASGATVVPVKVLDRRGSGAYSAIIAGVDYVKANAAPGDAANMSLGGGVYEPIDAAVQALGEAGIYVALAAGNESDDALNHSPARANGTNLFTTSACDINDDWAYFSNYGSPVDYCAPGVDVFSTYKSGGYVTMSGTSMAAPHLCGILLITGGHPSTDGYVNGDPDGDADPIAHL